jgi:uncharacterized protein (TIGR00255 family)
MIRSMTGFGSAAFGADEAEGSLELRSVNSRHLKLNFRLPSGAEGSEELLRETISAAVRRGHVDVTLRLAPGSTGGTRLRLDERRLAEYLAGFRELQAGHGIAGSVDLALVGRLEGVFVEESEERASEIDPDRLRTAAEAAVREIVEMRRREGQRLASELRERLAAIEERLVEVESLAPRRLDAERERLRRSVEELAAGVDVDPDRLASEIAILADRWDVREEIVRARAHLAAFEDLLELPEDEPVGKRLGFLSQELLREINTIGSKANDATIARHVVEAKNELETLREQIENVE